MSGERAHEIIDHKSSVLADKLDQGQGSQVADILRREAHNPNMSPREFNELVLQTSSKEQKYQGDDLTIQRDGSIVIEEGRNSIYAGHMNQQMERPLPPPPPPRGEVVCPDTGAAAEDGAVKGGLLGGLIGGIVRGNLKGALVGGVVGAGTGAAIEHNAARQDCHVVQPDYDNRR